MSNKTDYFQKYEWDLKVNYNHKCKKVSDDHEVSIEFLPESIKAWNKVKMHEKI